MSILDSAYGTVISTIEAKAHGPCVPHQMRIGSRKLVEGELASSQALQRRVDLRRTRQSQSHRILQDLSDLGAGCEHLPLGSAVEIVHGKLVILQSISPIFCGTCIYESVYNPRLRMT